MGFGEIALMRDIRRTATVKATENSELLALSRKKFERVLGPLDQLRTVKYLTDPRKIIADFFRPGDAWGPRGARVHRRKSNIGLQLTPKPTAESSWFAVYRPTSRDAINKMLNGIAVGKGLNVKGKSAKKMPLSGFVPYLQISQEKHKCHVEEALSHSLFKIFFTTSMARATARRTLEALLLPEENLVIDADCRKITDINQYEGLYGMQVPETVVREAYIMRPDISFALGWDTGRNSEPDFMNMNIHAVRGDSKPEVVLYQTDSEDPMNPHALVLAYAEKTVKPVVSDFDTFTVGSRGMSYATLDDKQVQLALWSLDKAGQILKAPISSQWNTCWLDVLKQASDEGFNPDVPLYGFGDRTSTGLTEQVVEATLSVGAVRHSSECFNYMFPQDFDNEYLIIWDQFPDMPWDYKSEHDLHAFLLDRIKEGYAFPVHPVWAARDTHWFSIFEELRTLSVKRPETAFHAWYPKGSGIVEKVHQLHADFPNGFVREMERPRPVREMERPRLVSDDACFDACVCDNNFHLETVREEEDQT